MKAFGLLIALLVIRYSCGTVGVKLSVAFENVTRHLFELETRMYIDNYDVDLNTLTSLVLKGLNERAMPFQLSNKTLDNEVQMSSSALVTFDSIKKLRTFNGKLNLTNKYYKPLQLFLFCQDASVKEIRKLTEDVARRHKNSLRPIRLEKELGSRNPKDQVIVYENTALTDVFNYEYFLVTEGQFIKLLTFVWYSPSKCGKLQLVEVNKFGMKTSKWENEKFSLEKLANFHGCKILSQNVVFDETLYSTLLPLSLQTNLNYILGESTGLLDSKVDFYLHKACYDNHDYMANFFNIIDPKETYMYNTKFDYFITWPTEYERTSMAVPASENYSEYEKLVMPFDNYTWALIAFTFVVAYATILIFYCVPYSIRDFVIGSNVSTPSLNILQIFFGIGLIVLPRRNFARFLTMSFILYCLIIRTAWQGKMFEFMTKDIPKPEIQTIEEMIEGGYDFYMEPYFKEMYPESEIAKRGKIVWNNKSDFSNLLQYVYNSSNEVVMQIPLFDPSFKGVLQVNSATLAYLMDDTKGRFGKRVRKDVFNTKMCGMAFMLHHHFTGIFDLKSQQLFTAGISHFNDGQSFDYEAEIMQSREKYKITTVEPKVLNLKKLEPGFVIFSSCLLFTLFVFVLELITMLPERIRPTFEDKHEFEVANLAMHGDAEVPIANFAMEAYETSVHTLNLRDSTEDLIEGLEIQNEITEQNKIVLEAQEINRRDLITDLLEGFKTKIDSIEQFEGMSENDTDSIDNAFDDLGEDFNSITGNRNSSRVSRTLSFDTLEFW